MDEHVIRPVSVKRSLSSNKHELHVFDVPEEKVASVNKCLASACASLNLNVAEIWEFVPITGVSYHSDEMDGESIGDDTEAPICVHVYSRFDDLDRHKAVIVGPWGTDEQTEDINIHKMSPKLCRLAYSRKYPYPQLWCYSSDFEFDRGIENPLSGHDYYKVAVTIPISAEYFGISFKCCVVFFSVNTVKRCAGVELFLEHMSKACILALTEDIRGSSNEWKNVESRSNSEYSDVQVFDDNISPLLPPFSMDVEWSSLKDIEHLADGSKFTSFIAKYNGTTVVVKVVRKATRDMSAAMKDLEAMMSFLLRCNHPHIVKLLGAGTVPERFLVIEWANGGNLLQWLKSGSPLCHPKSDGTGLNVLPLSIILKYGMQLAETMQYLNNRGISDNTVIYGDLRPSNIGFCIEPNGEYSLKLLDLGLAREIALKVVTTNDDDILSIRAYDPAIVENVVDKMPLLSGYIAPEVAEMRMFDEKADIFSFAMLMWSLITLEQPYSGIDRDQFYAAVVRGNTRPCLPPDTPEELKSLLVSCWDEDPTQRPPFYDLIDKLKSIDKKYAHDNVTTIKKAQ